MSSLLAMGEKERKKKNHSRKQKPFIGGGEFDDFGCPCAHERGTEARQGHRRTGGEVNGLVNRIWWESPLQAVPASQAPNHLAGPSSWRARASPRLQSVPTAGP